jgi:hypothetical protein
MRPSESSGLTAASRHASLCAASSLASSSRRPQAANGIECRTAIQAESATCTAPAAPVAALRIACTAMTLRASVPARRGLKPWPPCSSSPASSRT